MFARSGGPNSLTATAELKRRIPGADLQRMAGEAGWEERGGRIIRSGEGASADEIAAGRAHEVGAVVGRTKWVPKREWFQRMRKDLGNKGLIAPVQIQAAADAYIAGESLNAKQGRTIEWMLSEILAEREAFVVEQKITEDVQNDVTLDDLAEVGAEVSGRKLAIADLMASAMEVDDAATERAAIQFESDDDGLVLELKRIISHERKPETWTTDRHSARARCDPHRCRAG